MEELSKKIITQGPFIFKQQPNRVLKELIKSYTFVYKVAQREVKVMY